MAQSSGLIPTILLTGFLGAGKTTLLNRLIDHYQSRRAVLLINEFGQVGIDGALLHRGNYQKVELNKGSLFCICVRTDFIAEVERIADELQPDLLVIEATGLADTSEMERMLALPNLRPRIRLQASICLVDPQNFLKISVYLKAPLSQVRNADLVLLNKIDRVDEEQLQKTEKKIREIAPDVPIVRTRYAEFDLSLLDRLSHPTIGEVKELGDGQPDPVQSLTLEGKGSFSARDWQQWADALQPLALRVKGFVTVDGQSILVDGTPEQWRQQARFDRPAGSNQIVVIGRRLPVEELQSGFDRALENSAAG